MKISLKIIVIICCISLSSSAQVHIADKFEYRSQTSNGMTIPYRLFVPENYNPSVKYPIVLALHGSGERGSENQRHVNNYRLATVWADSVNQIKYPCFVVAPQCPANGAWLTEFPVDRYPLANEMTVVLKILESLENEFSIDTSKRYITGLSLGGYGTWDVIARYPDKFAAAIPMSGGGDIQSIPDLMHIPIWNFHGRLDNAVPINESTILMNEFSDNGRNVIYTHCSPVNCNGLPDSTIERLISEGADLLHTEYQNGGHVIWDESYDYKFLLDWVFSQYKVEDAINVIAPDKSDTPLNGTIEIKWESVLTGGFVDIYFSEDAGHNWISITKNFRNSGSYTWDTKNVNDCAFGQLKLILRDGKNIIRGYDNSEMFTIDNPEKNGKPYVEILNGHFPVSTVITDKIYNLELLIGDPESAESTLRIDYSVDGNSFVQIDSVEFTGHKIEQYNLPVNLEPLQNSITGYFRVSISDGLHSGSDESYSFIKETSRMQVSGSKVEYISKFFTVPFQLNIANPASLTNHEYLLTFDDFTETNNKTFSVHDITDLKNVVVNQEFSPNSESLIFDGLSFITEDIFTKVDLQRSSWNQNASKKLNFTMNKFVFNANAAYNGYAKPNDYKIIFYDTTVDSSSADTLPNIVYNERPVNFSVINMTTGKPVNIAYNTTGTISTTHNIWLLEGVRNKKRTWRITMVDNDANRKIPFGDTLYLFTEKGLSIYDTIKVLSNLVSVHNKPVPQSFYLLQNYPNPFNPKTFIKFGISEPGITKLEIFNSLGENVVTLLNEYLESGEHTFAFDGTKFSSGIYFYRLQMNNKVQVNKMLLLK